MKPTDIREMAKWQEACELGSRGYDLAVSRARTYVKADHSMSCTPVGGFESWTVQARENQLLATVSTIFRYTSTGGSL